jgi:hypothetical protein
MPPLPPLRVVAVVADEIALDGVVPRVNSRHSPRLTPAMRHHHLQAAAQSQALQTGTRQMQVAATRCRAHEVAKAGPVRWAGDHRPMACRMTSVRA